MHAVVGVLSDDTDPMVTVMKLEKAPQETYADIGGLDAQIQEIKVHKYANIFTVTTVGFPNWNYYTTMNMLNSWKARWIKHK